MHKTVRDMFGLESFEGAKVVAGESGLSNTVVGASLMEVPDVFPYLERDTLLLTTLFPIADDAERMDDFIARVYECGVAGVCIKPLRYIGKIPERMLQQADELGVPVLELPPDANLSNMANQILSLSLNEYIAQLQFRSHVHNVLAELLLNDSDVQALVECLGVLVERDVCVLDKDMKIMCAASAAGQLFEEGALADRVDPRSMLERRRKLLIDHSLYPIVAGKHRFGYVYVLDYPADSNDRISIDIAVEQSAILLAALFLKTDAVFKNQKNFRDVFIRDLLQGKVKSPIEIENKTKAFGMSLMFPQPVICLKAFTEDEIARKEFYDRAINTGLFDEWYAKLGDRLIQRVYLVYFNDAIVVLGGVADEDRLVALFRSIMPDLIALARAKSVKIGVGISDSCDHIQALDMAYAQAMSVLKTGGALNKQSFVDTYSKHRVFSIIENVSNVDTLKQFVRDKIGVLIDYDHKNGTDLMETLGLLIEGDLNYKRVAERSFIHYNTVRYRVSKIEQLGVGLKPGRDFAEVVVAHDCWVWLRALEDME